MKKIKVNKLVIIFSIVVAMIVVLNIKGTNSIFKIGQANAYVREIENKEFNAKDLNIMGYENVDFAQTISFILTKANSSSNGIEGIKLNGLSLKEHILNTCKVAYIENVNPNIMIAQQILETSIYAFGYEKTNTDGSKTFVKSIVNSSDNNYAGLGAVGSGSSGNGFSTNEEGQLAQAQHLKAYACEEPLNADVVDKRFDYVKRGISPTVAGLSNTWASNEDYGSSIARIYTELMNHEVNKELVIEYADKVFN